MKVEQEDHQSYTYFIKYPTFGPKMGIGNSDQLPADATLRLLFRVSVSTGLPPSVGGVVIDM